MDEMILSNRKYVTTKRAARVTGYAQDYVGQLIRSGKLKATKVGKAWFVAEDEVLKLAGKPDALQSPDRALAVLESKRLVESKVSVNVEYPKTWAPIHYFNDDKPLAPISDKRDSLENNSSIEILDVHRVRIARQTVHTQTRSPVRYSSFDGITFSASPDSVSSGLTSSAASGTETDDEAVLGYESTGSSLTLSGSDEVSSKSGALFSIVWISRVFFSSILVSLLVFLIPIVG